MRTVYLVLYNLYNLFQILHTNSDFQKTDVLFIVFCDNTEVEHWTYIFAVQFLKFINFCASDSTTGFIFLNINGVLPANLPLRFCFCFVFCFIQNLSIARSFNYHSLYIFAYQLLITFIRLLGIIQFWRQPFRGEGGSGKVWHLMTGGRRGVGQMLTFSDSFFRGGEIALKLGFLKRKLWLLQEISFNLTVFKGQHGNKLLPGVKSSRIGATIWMKILNIFGWGCYLLTQADKGG